MIAYHGKQEVKDLYLNRVEEHRKADQLIQGYGYWSDGKGCAVGCTLHSGNHRSYETELGIPKILAHLEARIFESLPKENARLWPGQFLAAIQPGADLSMVWPKFVIWLLVDPTDGVVKFAKNAAPIQAVANLYQRRIAGDEPSITEWRNARQAAAAAAAYAAYYAAAYYAAAYYAAARRAAVIKQSEKLLELLRAA